MSRSRKSTKPISPRAHSAIDYAFLAGNLVAPTLLGMSGKARGVFAAFGVIQGTLNALTVQPLAAEKVIPFALHGRIEKASAPIYFGVPLLAGLGRESRARNYWLVLGAALVTVYNLTDWGAKRTGR